VKTHTLLISGQHLTIRSAADPHYLEGLARELEGRLQAVGSQGAGPMTAALLAGLGLVDELKRTQAELAAAQQRLDERLRSLRKLTEAPARGARLSDAHAEEP